MPMRRFMLFDLRHRLGKCALLLISMLFVLVEVQAQSFNIYVKNKAGIPLENVVVYSFMKKSDAKAAFAQASAKDAFGYFDKQKYKPLDEQKTGSDGLVVIQATLEGAVILDGGDVSGDVILDVKLFNVSDYVKDISNPTFTLVYTGKEEEGKKQKDFENEATDLKEVPATAMMSMDAAGGGVSRFGKNYIYITRDLDVSGEHARSNARFVAFPTIVYEDFKDSLVHMPPMAIDGVEYTRYMDRRMSFDSKNDLLHDFRLDPSVHLEHNQSERVTYRQLAKIEKGTKYHVPGILWYEDHNGVYHRDSILFSDGKECEPMRFLNWEEARKFSALDTTLAAFKRRGTVSSVPVSKNVKLAFEQGSEQLNMSDSTTREQRESLINWLNGYYSNRNAYIKSITVRAYSSPEGTESRNRELSRARANHIRQLLLSRFANVSIKSEFDDFDNVVPWEIVADSMTMVEDSVSKKYAEQLRAIVAQHVGMDAQYRAIRAHADLYDYIDKNVLDKVRITSVEADIVEQTVLNKAQIVQKYYNEPDFLDMILPYQCYELLCYFAAEEDWEEMYTVAKKIYELHSKEHRVKKQMLKPGTKNLLTQVDMMVPYPLAAYYYALACMRKGEVNTEILKPYLDDGRVSVKGLDRHDKMAMNLSAFIVAQVLMYCQDEAFEEANALIMKYNLIKNPDLKGLIMFVLCLGGHYESNPEVRQYVMSSSSMNKAVIQTAMGKFDDALSTLYYEKDIPQNDAKVEYLKAICLFKRQSNAFTRFEAESMPVSSLYMEEDDFGMEEEKKEENANSIPTTWAVPMLNAIKLDETNLDYFKKDGYFNNAYRQMILYAWERMKAGVSLERISKEYGALVSRMKKAKETVAN